MRLLVISESPLEEIGRDYYAVESLVKIPQYLAAHCGHVTMWSPTVVREAGSPPLPGSWRMEPGNLTIKHQDYYYSFATYYRLWPWRRRVWRENADCLIKEHDLVMLIVPSPIISVVTESARRHRRPLVFIVAGDIETQSDRILYNRGLKRWLYLVLARLLAFQEVRCARHTAAVYVFSKELARRHEGNGRLVRLIQYPHLSLRDFVHREDTCQSDEIRLLRTCWLLPSKGIEYLLEAVALLLKRGLKVHLEVVGKQRVMGYQDSLESYAERLGIRDRVAFCGWVSFDKMAEVYLRSDINVISSLAEGTPRVIVEGFARGVPLVCTRVGGCEDFLAHEEDALLVSPGDPEAMALAIERIVRDGELRRKMIRHGYEKARSATFEILGMKLLEEFREIARASPK